MNQWFVMYTYFKTKDCRDDMFNWQEGRQGTGYFKMLLLQSKRFLLFVIFIFFIPSLSSFWRNGVKLYSKCSRPQK